MTKQPKEFKYTVKKSLKAKRVRLVVCCNTDVVVTVPHKIDMSIVDKFIIDKKSWIMEKIKYFRSRDQLSFAGGTNDDFLTYKEGAMKLVIERINFYNKFYNFKFNRISIRNQKSRWGSCSKNKNLNFNFKLALLPLHCADYIIIHELCHLKEMNHSKNFWLLVEKTCPNHKKITKEIKNLRN